MVQPFPVVHSLACSIKVFHMSLQDLHFAFSVHLFAC